MANYKSAVDLVIRGRTENLKGAFNQANKSLTTLSSKLVRLRTMAISTFGAYTAVRGLASLTNAALQFQKQMAEVHTMLREGNEQLLPAFSKEVRALSIQYGQSTETIAKGLYDILSAGIPAAGAMDVLKASLVSATGGLTDLQTAAYGATSVINAYGLAASEATHVNDLLYAIVEQGKIRFNELSSEIGKLAPVARAAGLSLEEMSALISTVVRVEEPARAMTAIRAALLSVAGTGKDFLTLIQSLKGASLAQIELAGFTRRASVAVSIMTGDISVLNDQLDYMSDVSGKSMGAAAKVMDTMYFSGEQLKQLFLDFKRVMGEEVARSIIDMGQELQRNKEMLEEWAKSIGKTIGRTIDFVTANKELLGGLLLFGAGVKVIAALTTVITGLGVAYAKLTATKTADIVATKAATVAMVNSSAARLALAKSIAMTTAAQKTGAAQSYNWANAMRSSKNATKSLSGSIKGLAASFNPLTAAITAAVIAFVIIQAKISKAKNAIRELREESLRMGQLQKGFEQSKTASEKLGNLKQIQKMAMDERRKLIEDMTLRGGAMTGEGVGIFAGEFFTGDWGAGDKVKRQHDSLALQIKARAVLMDQLEIQIKQEKAQKAQKKAAAAAYAQSPLGQYSQFLSKNESLIQEETNLRIKYIADAEQKTLAMADERWRKLKEKAAIAGQDLAFVEHLRQDELQKIRDKFAAKEAEKRKKEQDKLAADRIKLEEKTGQTIISSWIKLTKSGLEEQLLLIEHKRQEEIRKAKEIGADLDLINAKYAMLRGLAAQNQGGGSPTSAIKAIESRTSTRGPGYESPFKRIYAANSVAAKTRKNIRDINANMETTLNNILSTLEQNAASFPVWTPP